MATFTKKFVCLLIYRQTVSLPVGSLCLWTLTEGERSSAHGCVVPTFKKGKIQECTM